MSDLVFSLRNYAKDYRDPTAEALMVRAAARIAQLEAALRPFAALTGSEEYIKSAPDHGLCAAISYTAGDYRRARAALGEERT